MAAPEAVVEALPRGYRGPRRRVLSVDDEAVNRDVLRALLEPRGFVLEETDDGESALSKVAASAPNLVLMDVRLKRLDGLTTTAYNPKRLHLLNAPETLPCPFPRRPARLLPSHIAPHNIPSDERRISRIDVYATFRLSNVRCPPHRHRPMVFCFGLAIASAVGQRACARQTALARALTYTCGAKTKDHAGSPPLLKSTWHNGSPHPPAWVPRARQRSGAAPRGGRLRALPHCAATSQSCSTTDERSP